MNLSVKIIQLLHLCYLIFILIAPLLPFNILCISIGLLIKTIQSWGKHNDKCFLTILEYILLNKENLEEGFIYRLTNPLYSFKSEKHFENILKKIAYIWLIILIITAIYKYYKKNYIVY